LTRDTWHKVSELFTLCQGLDPEERQRYLRDREKSDPDVVAEVRDLLKHSDDKFLAIAAIDRMTAGSISLGTTALSGREKARSKAQSWFVLSLRQLRKAPVTFWVFAVINLLAVTVYAVLWAAVLRYGDRVVSFGWDAEFMREGWVIVSVDMDGPAAGKVRVGDHICGVNGIREIGGAGLMGSIAPLAPGVPYTITLCREGREYSYALAKNITIQPQKRSGFQWAGLAFLVVALAIWILKPDHQLARLACGACLLQALVTAIAFTYPYWEMLHGPAHLAFIIGNLLDGPHFALACVFYSALMKPASRTTCFGVLPRVLAVFSVLPLVDRFAWYGWLSVPLVTTNELPFWWLDTLVRVFYVFAPLSICGVMILGFRGVTDVQERRRAGWVLAGSLAGILPYGLVRLAGLALEATVWKGVRLTPGYAATMNFAVGFSILIPLTAAYAVLKHNFLDIRIVIRRSVQYLLAKSVLQVVLVLPLVALAYVFFIRSNLTVADLWLFLGLLVMLALMLRYRESLRREVDRRFFRESYRQEQVLMTLIESLQRLDSMADIVTSVGRQLSATLHPQVLQIFLRREQRGTFHCVYSSLGELPRGEVLDTSPLAYVLSCRNGAVSGPAARQWLENGLADEGLDASSIELLVPSHGTRGALLGFLLLGSRLSEQPYLASDRKLLEALAAQIAVVYENLSLQTQIDQRSKLSQDLRVQLADSDPGVLRECPTCGRCSSGVGDHCAVDGAKLLVNMLVPPVVRNRYQMECVLGKGGTGTVYGATDRVLNRRVAVKVVAPDKLLPATLRRFQREAWALASLSHPHIVAAYDFGTAESGAAYLVMELVCGKTLRTRMSGGSARPEYAAAWFAQMLDAIQTAHDAGIIHRDLKPENILIADSVDGAGAVKVMDFGLARIIRSEATDRHELTLAGAVFGTVPYMAPEQLRGEATVPSCDLFAIGVMAFEVLTGRVPFGTTFRDRLLSLGQIPVLPSAVTADQSRLGKVLRQCLALNPQERFASAAELERELVPLMAAWRPIVAEAPCGNAQAR
jgi:eukaryotic-like serine/threonine-protein kinase